MMDPFVDVYIEHLYRASVCVPGNFQLPRVNIPCREK